MSVKKILFATALFLTGCSGYPGGGEPLLRQPQVPAANCLSPEAIDQRLAVLADIPKPVDHYSTGEGSCGETTQCNIDPDGTENPGWVNCINAPGRGCTDHPASANYVLVGSQVKVAEIVLGGNYPSDRQLIKQIFPTGHAFKDKIFRPFCGDWCYPGSGAEGFRGTFYCDFVFYLTSEYDPNDPAKSYPLDPDLPPDGSIFDVYMREGAPIPEKAKCPADSGQTTNLKEFINRFFDVEAQQQTQPIIQYANDRWIYVGQEGTVKAKDISSGRVKLSDLHGLATFGGINYEVYQDLAAQFGPDFIYLTVPGEVEIAYQAYLNSPNDPTAAEAQVSFHEFHRARETKPRAGGLRLGTFQIPIAATWIKDWVFESKPAIYLYPKQKQSIDLKINPQGRLTTSLPFYPSSGWQIEASPDGKITYQSKHYPYLYYETEVFGYQKPKTGFIIPNKELEPFLSQVLPQLGLLADEIDDFLNYWLPKLKQRPEAYLLISFLEPTTINQVDPLEVYPKPAAMIRVRPYFKPLSQPQTLPVQDLPPPPVRKGFTLVEWGGILDHPDLTKVVDTKN